MGAYTAQLGQVTEESAADTRFPEFKGPAGVNLITRGAIDGYR
jgi:hypothetical protein